MSVFKNMSKITVPNNINGAKLLGHAKAGKYQFSPLVVVKFSRVIEHGAGGFSWDPNLETDQFLVYCDGVREKRTVTIDDFKSAVLEIARFKISSLRSKAQELLDDAEEASGVISFGD